MRSISIEGKVMQKLKAVYDRSGQTHSQDTAERCLAFYDEAPNATALPGKAELFIGLSAKPDKTGRILRLVFRTDHTEEDCLGARGGYLLPYILNCYLSTTMGESHGTRWNSIPNDNEPGNGVISLTPVLINVDHLARWLLTVFKRYEEFHDQLCNVVSAQNALKRWLAESRVVIF